jgi:23S rRNA (cytidine1920-2'-O)/16S rRNA (cytidine1409-2'-O)-methyltransferase
MTTPTRRRLDLLLVERGLFGTRAAAQAAIAAGHVTVDGVVASKASAATQSDAILSATPAHPYVSRGGLKLAAALDQAGIDVKGRVCLDVGASTGGFTDVLLRRGAARIYAVDVGHDQLHASLRRHPEVVSLEGTDIRSLRPERFDPRPDLAVIDVSFISLALVLPQTLAVAARPCDLIALIKPQFELKRSDLKKGIVRDPQLRAAACEKITGFLKGSGCEIRALLPSPVTGGDGNVEFLIVAHCR